MSAITFDTLASAKRLKNKGIKAEDAEELRLASETDVSHLATKEEVKTFVLEAKNEIIKWLAGMSFAQIGVILTLIKFH